MSAAVAAAKVPTGSNELRNVAVFTDWEHDDSVSCLISAEGSTRKVTFKVKRVINDLIDMN